MPSADRAAAHVFVAELASPELTPDDHHHLERVLRLRPGEVVTASDGKGGWVECRFRGGSGAGLDVSGGPQRTERPDPPITIAFAVMKGDRPEWTVQKLTEIGVDRIVPVTTGRSVVRWEGAKADRNVERLARVAREAAMQSRRVWLPAVEAVRPWQQLAGEVGGGSLALAHPGGDRPALTRPSVVVGPEGGWSDEELDGRPTVGLGPTVLRAETAAVAAAVVLAGLRSGLVSHA